MNRIGAWWVLGLVLSSACGELQQLVPALPDGGHAKVPGTYLDAKVSPGHRAHLALTGDKQLSCHDCHLIADAGFRSDAVKPCVTCHEKQQGQHHPFDGGVAMSCFSCHAFRSVGETALIDKWGCRRCHVQQLDGGAVTGPLVGQPNPERLPPHVTVHTKKCETCHRPHGAPFTKAADCGQCHDVVVSHGKGEQALVADTCMACHPHHSEATVAQAQCSSCHVSKDMTPKARVQATALFAGGHTSCSTCHRPHAFVAAEVKPCVGCHDDQPVLAKSAHGACTNCHQPHENRAAPKACESCHAKVHLDHPKDPTKGCQGCHPVHSATLASGSVAVPCASCHREGVFASTVVHAAKTTCQSCHEVAHRGKPKREGLCESCHSEQLTLVKKNRGHQDCGKCHEGLPHGGPVEPKACLTCHATKQPPQKGHTECAKCHESHSAKVITTCVGCHVTPERPPLPGLHAAKGHQKCSSCHAPHTPQPGFGPASCLSCHPQPPLKSHPTRPEQCISCHLFVVKK